MGSNVRRSIVLATILSFVCVEAALAQSSPTCPSLPSLQKRIDRQQGKVDKAEQKLAKYDTTTDNRKLSYENRAANFQARRQEYIENYQENCYLGGFLGGGNVGKCISKNKALSDKMKFQRDRVLSLLQSFTTKRAAGRAPLVTRVNQETQRLNDLQQQYNTCSGSGNAP